MNPDQIKILVTGRYQPDYNRTQIIIAGLKNSGVKVFEFPYKKKNRQTKSQLKALEQQADFIYLPSFTHMDVAFVKRHTSRPLIFDPLISKYMTKVHDYKKLFKYSVRSFKNYLKDKIMMSRADAVIADTYQHKKYFTEVIKIDPEKISIIPVGVDIHNFYPAQPRGRHPDQKFKVGFYGSFLPLHGIEKIIRAARLLKTHEEFTFEIVGNGHVEKKVLKILQKDPLQNLQLIDAEPYDQLNAKINSFDICLGIFGDSIKTDVVVPNKVYHYAACGKCIITKDTPAIREVFTDRTNIILSDGTPEDLAEKIILVKEDQMLRKSIERNAHDLMVNEYNQDMIARKLIDVFLVKFNK